MSSFKEDIQQQIQLNKIVKINISLGNINNNIMFHKINPKTFYNYLKFFNNKKKTLSNVTKYYYKDLILISINKNNIYKRRLNNLFKSYTINNTKYNSNINKIRIEYINERLIDSIKFPSIHTYDLIEKQNLITVYSNFKNSEIKIIFDKLNNTISYYSEIDIINLNNFIVNFNYLLSKLYYSKIKIS